MTTLSIVRDTKCDGRREARLTNLGALRGACRVTAVVWRAWRFPCVDAMRQREPREDCPMVVPHDNEGHREGGQPLATPSGLPITRLRRCSIRRFWRALRTRRAKSVAGCRSGDDGVLLLSFPVDFHEQGSDGVRIAQRSQRLAKLAKVLGRAERIGKFRQCAMRGLVRL